MYIESLGHYGAADLRSPFPFPGGSDRGKNKIDVLLSTCLVSNNNVVVSSMSQVHQFYRLTIYWRT